MSRHSIPGPALEVIHCDACGLLAGSRPKICHGCGCDLCTAQTCSVYPEYDPWTGEYTGDHGQWYCRSCHKRSLAVADICRLIREKAEGEIAGIKSRWKAECVKHKPEVGT